MEETDLELLILSNEPIVVNRMTIYPTRIKEIAKFGYGKYNQAIKILCMSQEEVKVIIKTDIKPFEFLQINMKLDKIVKEKLEEILSLIFKEEVKYSEEKQGFEIGKNILDINNFEEVVRIIGKINCISEKEEEKENPSNEKARMLLEKRRKLKEKLMKKK